MFFAFKLRPKHPADRLLCIAVVTRHHLLLLSLRTRLLGPGVAHGASPHSATGSGADPASCVTHVDGSAASAAWGGTSCCCRVPDDLPGTGVRTKNGVILA